MRVRPRWSAGLRVRRGWTSSPQNFAAESDRIRNLEKSLVERIADVDDDRRLNSVQMQRGWQALREELNVRLRRHAWVMGVGLAVSLAVAAVALVALHLHQREALARVAADLASLGADVSRLTAVEAQQVGVQKELDSLAASIRHLSAADVSPSRSSPQTVGAVTDTSPLAARIDSLAADQRRISGELTALRGDLQPLISAGAEPALPPAPQEAVTVGSPPARALESDQRIPPGPGPDTHQLTAEPDPLDRNPTTTLHATAGPEHPKVRMAQPSVGANEAKPPLVDLTITDRPFALQLIGSRSRANILESAARLNLPFPVYVRQEVLRGRPWYVLIHSLHGSHDEAQRALSQLAPEQRTHSPWIRALPQGARLEVLPRPDSP